MPTRAIKRQLAIVLLGCFGFSAAVSYVVGDNPDTSPSSSVFNDEGNQAPAKAADVSARPGIRYTYCAGGAHNNCIVDGDTLWSNGVKIRVADIDTPEVSEPRCAAEKALGDRATARLLELVNAGQFQMQAWPGRDEDKYGRKLRVLVRHGRSLGDILVSEGLARTWTGRRQPWC
ncbi:thermonuclease family protein [Rhizobium lentis]|uniref:thermonuclease family protein n=1 Tax=Rhizobium lentis TaxID=1138194 RepID=UPI001C82D141|nr:thermonuclease family protein [Rhizobium lentis]MBX5084619.1 thermonuclease family protein [Rhizobium lentis]MBX5096782.1 thermonuclease family protein [Rhizobium lentis]MBX5121756.1 thermonuclease family protein [Rhizobium lentis]